MEGQIVVDFAKKKMEMAVVIYISTRGRSIVTASDI